MSTRRLESYISPIYLGLIVLLCFARSWRPLRSFDDVWAHAAVGRWIWQHGTPPYHTILLWTVDDAPWIAHSWLSQLLFYGLFAAGGPRGGPCLVLLCGGIVTSASFALLWLLWARNGHVTCVTALCFGLAVAASALRFMPRPELFTGLLLALLIYWLDALWRGAARRIADGDEQDALAARPMWPLIAIPLLFALWANLHGAVALGVMLLLATAAADVAQVVARRAPGGQGTDYAKRLLLLAVMGTVAIFINPYGFNYWQALRPMHSITFSHLIEWKPFWVYPVMSPAIVGEEGLLWALAAGAWGCNPRRRWAHLLWLLLMGAAFWSARRQQWMLALVSLAVLCCNANRLDFTRLWPRRTSDGDAALPPKWLVGASGLCGVLVLFCFLRPAVADLSWPLSPLSPQLPTALTRFVRTHALPSQIFNDSESSAYLHWQFGESKPLFIDALDAFPDWLTLAYGDVLRVTPAGRHLLADPQIGYVVLRAPLPGESLPPLVGYLDASDAWKRVYSGGDGTVWVRRASTPAHPHGGVKF